MEKDLVFDAAQYGICRVQVLGSQKMKKMQGILNYGLSLANQVKPMDPKPGGSKDWGYHLGSLSPEER